MEEAYMNFFYRIPLASSTLPFMMSYQCNQYTADYNIMYGFGGIELMIFNYTDAEWAEFVASQGGTLNYE
jgi:oligopeptide transport system substrate-binding protein